MKSVVNAESDTFVPFLPVVPKNLQMDFVFFHGATCLGAVGDRASRIPSLRQVMDSDLPLKGDDYIGFVEINTMDMPLNQNIEGWFEVRFQENKQRTADLRSGLLHHAVASSGLFFL